MEKTILITGSTDGIGKQTAIELASRGWRVIVHGRNQGRVDKSIWDIRNIIPNANILGCYGDFRSLNDVDKMANEIIGSTDELNVLLNNAGVLMKSFELSDEGFEMTFAVNHLAHFYLTGRLLPLLLKTNGARVINVSSGIHSNNINLNRFLLPEEFESVKSYSDSKLCNILYTNKMDRLFEGESIGINSMHPGVINTKMLKNTWGAVGSDLKEGVDREVFLVSSKDLDGISGKYIDSFKIAKSSKASYDIPLQDELWRLSLKMISDSELKNPYSAYL